MMSTVEPRMVEHIVQSHVFSVAIPLDVRLDFVLKII